MIRMMTLATLMKMAKKSVTEVLFLFSSSTIMNSSSSSVLDSSSSSVWMLLMIDGYLAVIKLMVMMDS